AGDALHVAADADLAFKLRPVEEQRSTGISVELMALGALVVAIEDEAALIEAFEQEHAGSRDAGRAGSGDGHRVGLATGRDARLTEPEGELVNGIGIDVVLCEPAGGVVFSEISN